MTIQEVPQIRGYLRGTIYDYDPKVQDYTVEQIKISRVPCPIWQCSGFLYWELNDSYGEQSWQIPDIKCDDCGTRFSNGLRRSKRQQT